MSARLSLFEFNFKMINLHIYKYCVYKKNENYMFFNLQALKYGLSVGTLKSISKENNNYGKQAIIFTTKLRSWLSHYIFL